MHLQVQSLQRRITVSTKRAWIIGIICNLKVMVNRILILQSTNFASAVASSKNQFTKISNIVSKYCGQKKAEQFLKACDNLDFKVANMILDDAVKELTGYDSVVIALSVFADKFPQLGPALSNEISSALSESDKVKVIDGYRLKIINIIDGMC